MHQFKTSIKLIDHYDDDIVYIPEKSIWFDTTREYNKADFVKLCNDNIEQAQLLLDRLEWQHPETLIEEDKNFDN